MWTASPKPLNILKNHRHILQFPKELPTEESTALIDDFLNDILDKIFKENELDTYTSFCYKTFMFKHMECIATNNKFHFVFDEKALDKLT